MDQAQYEQKMNQLYIDANDIIYNQGILKPIKNYDLSSIHITLNKISDHFGLLT